MKNSKTIVAIALTTLLSLTVAGVVMADEVQKVTVTISGMNYSPSEVSVEKGVPVEMTFARDDKPTCGGKILFPELGIEREVAAGETVTVEFTPTKSGELNFTCGMKMMKGKIIVTQD